MKMHCPHCGVKGSVDDSYIGRKVRCPKCHNVFHCEDDQRHSAPPVSSQWSDHPEEKAPDTVETADTEQEAVEGSEEPFPAEITSPVEEQAPGGEPEPWTPTPEPEPAVGERELEWETLPDDVAVDIESVVAEDKGDEAESSVVDQGAAIAPVAVSQEVLPSVAEDEPVLSSVETFEKTRYEEPGDSETVLPAEPERETESAGEGFSTHPEVPLSLEVSQPVEAVAAVVSPADESAEERPAPVATVPPPGAKPHPDFTVGEALTEAWRCTRGAKGTVWAALGVMYLVMLVLGFGLVFLQMSSGLAPESAGGVWLGIGIEALSSAVSTLFTAGLLYIGVCLAAGKSCSWKMVIAGFPAALQLLIAAVLMTLLVISGVFLLVLPGIYLAVGYTLTLPLMLDRGLGPWEAMEKSRKAIHKVWWKVFGLFLVMGLITAVSAIPLGIGLIWTLPMNVVLCGVVYRYLFGVQGGRN